MSDRQMNQIKKWWIWLKRITGKHELKRLGAFYTVTLTDFSTAVGRLHMQAYSEERDAQPAWPCYTYTNIHQGEQKVNRHNLIFPNSCDIHWLHTNFNVQACLFGWLITFTYSLTAVRNVHQCIDINCYCNWCECRRCGALFISVQWIVMYMS